jgi:hypothetical protein
LLFIVLQGSQGHLRPHRIGKREPPPNLPKA